MFFAEKRRRTIDVRKGLFPSRYLFLLVSDLYKVARKIVVQLHITKIVVILK